MRLEVQASGYDTAADALLSANQLAAITYDTLTGKLAGYSALGGDDRSSEDFVRDYDSAAAEGVQALRALVDALANVGLATAASGANHRRANADSVFGGDLPDYTGDEPLGDRAVEVPAFTPPTALGGDNADMPDWWNEVVDHLQGWGWPSANTDQLRDAAEAWRAAGSDVAGLTKQIDSAIAQLGAQRSPEVPVAVGILTTVRGDLGDLATELTAIGGACTDYATQVDETRQTIKDLLRDLAIEVGATAAVSFGLSFVTFGGAGAVGAGVITVRVIKYAHRILAALRGLQAARAVATVAACTPRLVRVRNALERLRRARGIVRTFDRARKGQRVSREALNAKQAKNLKRFEKRLPSGAQETTVRQLPDGSASYTSSVPGRVPGSRAEYTKIVDEAGNTTSYVKTTYGPDGKIIHIKDKMTP